MKSNIKNISITDLRKDLFNTLDEIYLRQEPVIISKSNIPLVVISPVQKNVSYSSENRERLSNLISEAHGTWKDDSDWDEREKERDRLEKKIAENLRKAW